MKLNQLLTATLIALSLVTSAEAGTVTSYDASTSQRTLRAAQRYTDKVERQGYETMYIQDSIDKARESCREGKEEFFCWNHLDSLNDDIIKLKNKVSRDSRY